MRERLVRGSKALACSLTLPLGRVAARDSSNFKCMLSENVIQIQYDAVFP